MSAGQKGITKYRARRKGISSQFAHVGKDGGGKLHKKRRVYFEQIINGKSVSVDGPKGKNFEGWTEPAPVTEPPQ